jgi:hypothetical protein
MFRPHMGHHQATFIIREITALYTLSSVPFGTELFLLLIYFVRYIHRIFWRLFQSFYVFPCILHQSQVTSEIRSTELRFQNRRGTDSIVTTTAIRQSEILGSESRRRHRFIASLPSPDRSGTDQWPVRWIPETLSQGAKRPRRETNHPALSSADDDNA